jgi:hypothetical protein
VGDPQISSAYLQFAESFFADLKLLQIRKYLIFLLTNINLKRTHSNLRMTFCVWDSFETKKILEIKECGSGSEILLLTLHFADLQFADWDTKEICGFSIAE